MAMGRAKRGLPARKKAANHQGIVVRFFLIFRLISRAGAWLLTGEFGRAPSHSCLSLRARELKPGGRIVPASHCATRIHQRGAGRRPGDAQASSRRGDGATPRVGRLQSQDNRNNSYLCDRQEGLSTAHPFSADLPESVQGRGHVASSGLY